MRKTPCSGFTLTETMMALAVSLVVIAGVYCLLTAANILGGKNLALDSTGTESHNTLDRVQEFLQQSYTVPIPIDATGATLSTSLSITGTAAMASGMAPVVTGTTAVVTGTGAGIKFYRYMGGPYLTLITGSAGLSGSATSLSIQRDTAAQVVPPLPQAGDILIINTTALLSGNGYQVWATVSGSPTLNSSSGTQQTYTVPLTAPMKDQNGNTVSGISYQTDNTGKNPVSWSTSLLRPTAFLVSVRGTQTELGMIEPFVAVSSSSVNITTNYTTLTREIDIDPTKPSLFSIVSFGSSTFVSLVLRIRASAYDNYMATKQTDGYSTAMSTASLIELKSNP